MAAGAGLDADFPGLPAKRGSVIQGQSSLDLPLVHHFMENRVFDFCPDLVPDVGPADRDGDRFTGSDVHAVFAEAGLHPAGEPKGDRLKYALEVLLVESLVSPGQLMKDSNVTGTRSLSRFRTPGRGWSIELDGK